MCEKILQEKYEQTIAKLINTKKDIAKIEPMIRQDLREEAEPLFEQIEDNIRQFETAFTRLFCKIENL